jgi:TRAP-type mannitol/chloroaromatic compound transport system substrate-binding protein
MNKTKLKKIIFRIIDDFFENYDKKNNNLIINNRYNCNKKILKSQSAYNLFTPILGENFSEINDNINELVYDLKINGKGPNEYVPMDNIISYISNGTIDACYSGLGYSNSSKSIYHFFTSIPFSFSGMTMLSWLINGGGLEKLNKLAKKDNLYMIPATLVPPETGGWTNIEIKTPDDIKKLKMRIYGLGAEVIKNMGGETIFLSQDKLIDAIEDGTINSCEFSCIEIDDFINLPEYFNYWYYPSWNQPSTVIYYIFNLDVWNNFSINQKKLIETIIKENCYNNYLKHESTQSIFLKKYEGKLKKFPKDVLDNMRKAFLDILNKKENVLLKEYYDDLIDFEKKSIKYNTTMLEDLF